MMNYRYVAFDHEGRRVEGWIEAPDETAAEQVLWGQELTVAQLVSARQRPTLSNLFPTFFGVKRRDLIIFSRQLATLLSSGISILPALRLLAEQSASHALQEVLQAIVAGLQQGRSFSAMLLSYPLVFPDLYARTTTVGERTGNLEEVLRRLASYLEREEALVRKLRDTLIYPVFVLIVAVLVVVLMLTVAFPPMVSLFETFEAELPWTTRALIAASNFTTAYGVYVLFGGLILAAVLAWWSGQPTGRRFWNGTVLSVPILGQVSLQGQLARFAHTGSVLIRAGLPLSEVMELAVRTTGNVVVADALERARVALLAGKGLSVPLSAERLFPSLLAQMVRVGEETGTLEDNLETLSTFYEEEVDRSVKLMASLMEPVLMIFIALIVGFIAVSMVMPMYSILLEIK
ncbi:MAG: type II secretion system F family protein [Chloroflexota bacterium]|nr:type II secretion system F family protein [Chloroflexota bacterium]